LDRDKRGTILPGQLDFLKTKKMLLLKERSIHLENSNTLLSKKNTMKDNSNNKSDFSSEKKAEKLE